MTNLKTHDRKLGILMASLTKSRPPRYDIEVAGVVRDELESIMISSGYLDHAPFEWVTIALRYGLKNDDKPHYQQVNKDYGDLPLSIELDINDLRAADKDGLERLFKTAGLKALIHAGEKYGLPVDKLAAS